MILLTTGPYPFTWGPWISSRQNFSQSFSRMKQSRKGSKSWEFIVGLCISGYLFWSCSECLLAIILSQVDESSLPGPRHWGLTSSVSPGTGPAL